MAIFIPPPVRPSPKGYGNKPSTYYTLHSSANDIFAISINESEHTSVIGFRRKNDALFMGEMIEMYYKENQEWPKMDNGSLYLPASMNTGVLSCINIGEVDFEDLKLACTRNIMNLVSVDSIISTDGRYSFSGNLYKFEAPVSFYQDRFEEFM